MTIIDQIDPAGPTAWLAAVGLAHLTKHRPADPVELADLAERGPLPSRPSRWVELRGTWLLDIDQPAGWAELRSWYAARFDPCRTNGDRWTELDDVPRAPWWRVRGNATPHGVGAAIWAELEALDDVDVTDELAHPRIWTDGLRGWVIDRKWIDLGDPHTRQRPVIRYALAYIGATVACRWPGHMLGSRSVGHLWDGQPADHPTVEHTVIVWDPDPEPDARYPAWWGAGTYATVPGPSWEALVRDRWLDAWMRWELLGRTEARRIVPDLPEPHLVRARVPLWRRSVLLRGGGEDIATAARREYISTDDRPLDLRGVAELTGLSVSTLRSYVRDGAMPEEDGTMGQSAWWWASTITAWQATRPTPGRPRDMRKPPPPGWGAAGGGDGYAGQPQGSRLAGS